MKIVDTSITLEELREIALAEWTIL